MRLSHKICLLGCICGGLCVSTILVTSCSVQPNLYADYAVGQQINVNGTKEAKELQDVAITKLPVESKIGTISVKKDDGTKQLIGEMQHSVTDSSTNADALSYGESIIYWEVAYHVATQILAGSKKGAKGSVTTGTSFYTPGYKPTGSSSVLPKISVGITYKIDNVEKTIPANTNVSYTAINETDTYFKFCFENIDSWKTRVLENVAVDRSI